MAALETFEGIARCRSRIKKTKLDIAELESLILPHAQGFDPTGHGTIDPDKMTRAALISMQIGELRALLPLLERRLELMMERANHVLYGRDGRGGLAKARSSTDADILCCHYLQGMSWADVAREICRAESNYPTEWARKRAVRACEFIDRYGADNLANG